MANIAIVIPALNEEAALRQLLTEIPPLLHSGLLLSITEVLIELRLSPERRMLLLLMNQKRGYGRACFRGFTTAKDLGAEFVIFMDGDGSDDPADLSSMLAPVVEGRRIFPSVRASLHVLNVERFHLRLAWGTGWLVI